MSFIRKVRRLIIDSLGFSKTEANGFLVLILIVFLVAIVPRIYFEDSSRKTEPEGDQSLEQWATEMTASIKRKKKETNFSKSTRAAQSVFDPNQASAKDMRSGGLPQYLAIRIVKYRDKGGRFKEVDDLKKMYGMTDSIYSRVKNFVSISKTEAETNLDFKKDRKKENEFKESVVEISIELNSASKEELQSIRGIGPVLSERIVKYRDMLGGFYSEDQLKEVYGLKEEVIEQVIQMSVFNRHVNQKTINTDSIKFLASHPYIDYNLARAIINYRQVHGSYESVDKLLEIKVMNDSLYQKLSPYLSL